MILCYKEKTGLDKLEKSDLSRSTFHHPFGLKSHNLDYLALLIKRNCSQV